MNAWIKLLAAALLFALWGALVFTHQADPKDLVTGIMLALTGLGVFHATTNSAPAAPEPAAGVALLAEPATPAEPALAGSRAPVPPVAQVAPAAAAPSTIQ